MKKTIALFKIIFNTTYGISSLKYKSSKNNMEMLKAAGIIILIIFSLSPMMAGYIYYMNISYDGLAMLGQPGAIITLGIVASSIMVLFFGFFYVISTFYFTSDTEHLVSLPLRASQIIGAKFSVILISQYLVAIPLALTPVLVFGFKSGAGFLYYIYAIVGMLVIPIIPLCLTSVLAIMLMRLVNLGKKKDLFTTIGGIVALALMLGVQMYIQRAAVSGNPEQINSMLFAQNGLINTVAKVFPPAGWISIGLINYGSLNGLLYMMLFLGAAFACLVGFGYMAEIFFLGGYLGSKEIHAKRKKLNEGQLVKGVGTRSKISAIFWREYKILNRVPIFFMNNVLIVIIVPVIFLMMYFTTGSNAMGELKSMISSSDAAYVVSLVAAGIAIFTISANLTPPTSLSREGAQFFISKYIPVSPKEQILGKALHSLMLTGVGNVLIVATLGFMLKMSVINIIISFTIATAASVPIIEIGLIIDLFRPLLVWDNPQKAVKQNMNGVISLFFNTLWAEGLLFLIGNFISNALLTYVLLILIFTLLGIVLYKVLMGYANKRYADIEP